MQPCSIDVTVASISVPVAFCKGVSSRRRGTPHELVLTSLIDITTIPDFELWANLHSIEATRSIFFNKPQKASTGRDTVRPGTWR